MIAKRYAEDRIEFFSACYRRERGVLELLHRYGCAVPQVFGGELGEDQALLIMQDLGDETLAERLEASDHQVKGHWLRSAVSALAGLHATAHGHLDELTEEIRKIDKESLGPQYYFSALRIALDRVAALTNMPIEDSDWRRIAEQAGPLVDFLCEQPGEFIHFEFTPHHVLVTDGGPRRPRSAPTSSTSRPCSRSRRARWGPTAGRRWCTITRCWHRNRGCRWPMSPSCPAGWPTRRSSSV